VFVGIAVNVVILGWFMNGWFDMPWPEFLLAVSLQSVLIIAGLRVIAITGQGPVSLMTNATQFVFSLIWPAHLERNLNAAYVAGSAQASSESMVPTFWVAQRIGGKFTTLILAQLIVIPIGALLTPFMFNALQQTYGIGLQPGQLTAPTDIKIASLAIVMKDGLAALPHGALLASIIGLFLGVGLEFLLAATKRNEKGEELKDVDGDPIKRFWWVPIPAAFGFALILPPAVSIATALGSVIAAVWKKLSPAEGGSYTLFQKPLAAGLMAGEVIVVAIHLPLLAALMGLLKPYL